MKKEPNKNLIVLQEEAVAEILSLPEQGKRAASYGFTLLNKRARGLRRVYKTYSVGAAKWGFNAKQIEVQLRDVMDLARLEAAASE